MNEADVDAPRVLRVLIADDDFGSRQLLGRLLNQFTRAQVCEARNGREAVEQFRLWSPDISFLDIDMPERDGLDVLAEIRSTGAPAFVVMVSALGSLAKVQQALELGVKGFIVKPYSARRVVDTLRRYAAEPAAHAAALLLD